VVVAGAILALWCFSVTAFIAASNELRTPIVMPIAIAVLAAIYAAGYGIRMTGKPWPDKAISPFVLGSFILSALWFVGELAGMIIFDRGFATVPLLLSLLAAILSAIAKTKNSTVQEGLDEPPPPPPLPPSSK
jgi:peptidoglycan/LPS O-acetylase OafA/YrhL